MRLLKKILDLSHEELLRPQKHLEQLIMKQFVQALAFIVCCSMSFQSISQEEKADNKDNSGVVNIADRANMNCIIPPAEFDTLGDFNGYFHRQNGASILLLKVEGKSVSDAEQSLDSTNYFESINAKLITKSKLVINSGDQLTLYKLEFSHDDVKFVRYHAFTGNDKAVLWAVSTYRRIDEEQVEVDILNSFKTLNFEKR